MTVCDICLYFPTFSVYYFLANKLESTSNSLSGLLVFERKIFSSIFLHVCKNLTPHCGPILSQGSRFEQTWIYTTWRYFLTSFKWRFLKNTGTNKFSIIMNYLPFKGDLVLHLNKIKVLHSGMFCVKFGWNLLIGSREEENVKSLQMDKRQTKSDQKSSLELSAQKHNSFWWHIK